MLATIATVEGWTGVLNLSFNKIIDEGAKFIGEGVKNSTTLILLNLDNNKTCAEGAKYIGEGVKHSTTLNALELSDANLTDAAKDQVRQARQACSFQNLTMIFCFTLYPLCG